MLNRIPSQQLEGKELDGGWKVISRIIPLPHQTGGNFSEGYLVRKANGVTGFLKALDFSSALLSPDPARNLQALTEAYNYERNLLEMCRGKNLDRVCVSLADGTILATGNSPIPVPYIIFEQADTDIRRETDLSSKFDLAWSLRALHHVATGIWQLHQQQVAHQDLKPSNVLVFSRTFKISDLGRSSQKGSPALSDGYKIAGDPSYAPPELLYGMSISDWTMRRMACDVYLLGSMAAFFFTKVGMTPLLLAHLANEHKPTRWGGSFDDVLPYIRDAFGKAVVSISIPTEVDTSLRTAIRELCEPDPRLRGHPMSRAEKANSYSIERYVSLFNLLAGKAEWSLKRITV